MGASNTLWVPKGISWEAQLDRAVMLHKQGTPVVIHEHSTVAECQEGLRCGKVLEGGIIEPLEPSQ